jgi:hypothetical protein
MTDPGDAIGGGVGPTLGGFVQFVTNIMAPPAPFVPSTSPYVTYAFDYASQVVNYNLQAANGIPGAWNLYALAVYNLAADFLINIVQDPANAPTVTGSNPPMPYWQYLRSQLGIASSSLGVVQSTGDDGTSVSLMLPSQFSTFTLANMLQTKTPYGRQYLAIAGSWGSLWGMD